MIIFMEKKSVFNRLYVAVVIYPYMLKDISSLLRIYYQIHDYIFTKWNIACIIIIVVATSARNQS